MRSRECPCYRHGVCPPDANVVPFHGPEDARLVVVGEAPGATENAKGIPFCGDSGSELDRLYLPAAGMSRQDVYVANAVRCLPVKNPPSKELIRHCSSEFLLPYISGRKSDAVFVALGKTAEDVLIRLLPPQDAALDRAPGAVRRFAKGWLVCAPHPAAAMRSESRTGQTMDQILLAFRQAGRLLRDTAARRRSTDEILFSGSASCWEDLVFSLGDPDTVALDTETMGVSGPLVYLSLACRSDERTICSRVLPASRIGDWEEAVRWLCQRRVVMHHALYDIEAIAGAAGWDLALRLLDSVEDTMLLAYEFRGLPLGLKPLADLLAGMPMRSFDSAMAGPFTRALRQKVEQIKAWIKNRAEQETEARVSGSLFEGEHIPAHLSMQPGESAADYSRRLQSLPDEELAPLAGKTLAARQGRDGHKEACALAEEVNRRFSWLETLSAIGRAERLLDGTMEGIEGFLTEARQCRLLQPLLPKQAYELIAAADVEEVAEYANSDAIATLLVWEELTKLL